MKSLVCWPLHHMKIAGRILQACRVYLEWSDLKFVSVQRSPFRNACRLTSKRISSSRAAETRDKSTFFETADWETVVSRSVDKIDDYSKCVFQVKSHKDKSQSVMYDPTASSTWASLGKHSMESNSKIKKRNFNNGGWWKSSGAGGWWQLYNCDCLMPLNCTLKIVPVVNFMHIIYICKMYIKWWVVILLCNNEEASQ